jgi:hypothetical protein
LLPKFLAKIKLNSSLPVLYVHHHYQHYMKAAVEQGTRLAAESKQRQQEADAEIVAGKIQAEEEKKVKARKKKKVGKKKRKK